MIFVVFVHASPDAIPEGCIAKTHQSAWVPIFGQC